MDGPENGISRYRVEVTGLLATGNVTDSSMGHVSGSGIVEMDMLQGRIQGGSTPFVLSPPLLACNNI